MRRGVFAVLALIFFVVFFVASGFAAAMGFTETAVFERLPQAAAIPLNFHSVEPGAATFDMDPEPDGAAFMTLASDLSRIIPRAMPNASAVKGKKTREHFPYGLVLVASPLKDARETGGETAELATMLMIGVGLISVGLFRRLYRVA